MGLKIVNLIVSGIGGNLVIFTGVPYLNLSNCEIKLGNSPIVGKSAKIKLFSPLLGKEFRKNEFGIIKSE